MQYKSIIHRTNILKPEHLIIIIKFNNCFKHEILLTMAKLQMEFPCQKLPLEVIFEVKFKKYLNIEIL